jgi:hypothetical protein
MYNYIKCKYQLEVTTEEKTAIDQDWNTITFLCDPILGKVGEFLIRGNGELCHNLTEYEKVNEDQAGQPGVVWDGTGYARVKSTEWKRIDLSDTLTIQTQIISKKTDADVKIEFKFENGYVVSHKSNITLIDNEQRLSHDKKIKEFAIKRATQLNSKWYRAYDVCLRTPLLKLVRSIGYIGSYLQDFSWKLERQLSKR